MMDRVARSLAKALLTAALVAPGCGLLPKSTTVEVRPTGDLTAQLQSLYVIVAPKDAVADALATPSKYKDLLQEDRIRKYTSFVQYQPDGTSWRQVYAGQSKSEYVEHEIDEDLLEVNVNHKLLDRSKAIEYALVVLGFFGSGGYEQVTVDHGALDESEDQVVNVSGGSLTLLADG